MPSWKSRHASRNKYSGLIQTLSLKIDYRRCGLSPPIRARYELPVLADALAYMELLKTGKITTVDGYKLSYDVVVAKIQVLMGHPVTKPIDKVGEGIYQKKTLLLKSIMEYIDLLVRHESAAKNCGNASGYEATWTWRCDAGASMGGAIGPVKTSSLASSSETDPWGIEGDVDRALNKIEEWADDWLDGRLEGDAGWKSFDRCLDRK